MGARSAGLREGDDGAVGRARGGHLVRHAERLRVRRGRGVHRNRWGRTHPKVVPAAEAAGTTFGATFDGAVDAAFSVQRSARAKARREGPPRHAGSGHAAPELWESASDDGLADGQPRQPPGSPAHRRSSTRYVMSPVGHRPPPSRRKRTAQAPSSTCLRSPVATSQHAPPWLRPPPPCPLSRRPRAGMPRRSPRRRPPVLLNLLISRIRTR